MPKFTRADLRKILGEAHTEEIENQIMALHLGVVDAIKDDLSKAKADADKLPGVQAELDKLKGDGNDENSYKAKYEKEHADFEKFKADQSAKDARADKSSKYRDLLKKAGVSDKRLDSVLKVTDMDSIKLDKNGNIEDPEKLLGSIRTEWADFIATDVATGVKTPNPPATNGGVLKTREDIYKRDDHGRFVMDAAERQKALSQIIAAEQQKG